MKVYLEIPEFDRPSGSPAPRNPPTTPAEWEKLRERPRRELEAMGFQAWDENLLLFPREWYFHIPEGFVCENIFGKVVRFSRADFPKDARYGALAYGLRAAAG